MLAFAVLANAQPQARIFASGALEYARKNGLSGNVLNSYAMGGTLIFHRIPTYIDGRTDQLFLQGFSQRDLDSGKTTGKPILTALLRQYDVKWTLLESQDSRIPFFDELPGWRRAYAD